MTTTNFTIGIGDGDKISSKVLKPPGGETHDIFCTSAETPSNANTHQRNQNHLKSSVFGGDEVDSFKSPQETPKQKYGNGNRSNIFGLGDEENEENDEDRKQRKVKDYLKSNIFGDDNEQATNSTSRRAVISNGLASTDHPAAGLPSFGTPATQRNFVRKQGGNPITGEGYINGSSNGDVKENGQQFTRGRNPPGGHSTKLW